MRLLSPHARFSLQVFEAREQIVMDARGFAQLQVLDKPVVADFQTGGLLDHEIEVALTRFNFSGLPDGVNPLTRVSVFDTEAYAQTLRPHERDEIIVQMEDKLREMSERSNRFIIVEQPRAERPWPSYDEDSIEDVLKFQERLRIEPTRIRLYELENANRPEIVLAMLRKEDPEAAARYEAEQPAPKAKAKAPAKKSEADVEPEPEPVSVEA